MQVSVILTQMGVIVIFLALGFLSKKKNWVHASGTKDMSWMVITMCAPAQILFAVIGAETLPERKTALGVLAFGLGLYLFLILLGYAMGWVVRAPRSEWKFYRVMTVFGNVGFLGLPLCQAIFGNTAVIYMAMFNLMYNIFFYTWGVMVLRPEGAAYRFSPIRLLNPGTIAATFALICLLTGLRFPAVISESARYMSNAVTFLAVFIIGANMGGLPLKEFLSNKHAYLFISVRQLILPVITILIFKRFVSDPAIVGSVAVQMAVPVGTALSMAAAKNDLDLTTLTEVTVLSTMLSVVTMTIIFIVAGAL